MDVKTAQKSCAVCNEVDGWLWAARVFTATDVVTLQHYFLQGASDPWCSVFLCPGAKWSLVAEFGVETQQAVLCTSRDVTVGNTILRWQTNTMLLQKACKRLDSANRRFGSFPLTSYTPHTTRSLSITHLPPASRYASRLHVPVAPSAKSRVFSIPVTSSTPQITVIPSFLTFSFLCYSHRICNLLGLLGQQYTTKHTKTQFVLPPILVQHSIHLPNLVVATPAPWPHRTLHLLDLAPHFNSSSITLSPYSRCNIFPFLSSKKMTSNNNSGKTSLTCVLHTSCPCSTLPLVHAPPANPHFAIFQFPQFCSCDKSPERKS